MKSSPVYLVNPKLKRATKADVKKAERQIGALFPPGYAKFVTEFGEGAYCDLVRVYLPQRVVKDLKEFRQRVVEYFLWDEGKPLLSPEQVGECVSIADTYEGDELVFHPSKPSQLYLLPRHRWEILRVGSSLDGALRWLCQSGKLYTRRSTTPYFDSMIGQRRMELARVTRGTPSKKTKQALLNLQLHDFVVDATSKEGVDLQVFMQKFAGYVSCTGGRGDYNVCVWYAGRKSTPELKRVLDCLEDLGFVSLAASKGRRSSKIVEAAEKYFQLDKVLPCPIVPEDRTPEDVVRAFIKAMHGWETGMDALNDAGLPCELGHKFRDEIIRDLCVPRRRTSNWTFHSPSSYQPKKEKVVDVKKQSADQVVITTKRTQPWRIEQHYKVKRRKGVWQLDSVTSESSFGRERLF